MSKSLKQTAFDRLRETLDLRLPMFMLLPKEISKSTHGESVWEWKYHPFLAFYICYWFSDKWDQFYIDGAWSERARWPRNLINASPRTIPGKPILKGLPKDGEFRFRMAKLWDPQFGNSWEIERKSDLDKALVEKRPFVRTSPEILISRVDPLGNDAVEKITQYGIPYFQEVAQEHGHPFDFNIELARFREISR